MAASGLQCFEDANDELEAMLLARLPRPPNLETWSGSDVRRYFASDGQYEPCMDEEVHEEVYEEVHEEVHAEVHWGHTGAEMDEDDLFQDQEMDDLMGDAGLPFKLRRLLNFGF